MFRSLAHVFIFLVLLLSACAASPLGTTAKSAVRHTDTEHNSQRSTAVHTFGELIRQPVSAEQAADDCLLFEGRTGVRLAASLSPATKTLPELPTDLAAILAAAPGPARVLSPWGRLGPDGQGPVLIALTRVPLRAAAGPAFAVFATSHGAYVRSLEEDATSLPTDPQTLDALQTILSQRSAAPFTVFLTGDADLTTKALTDLLRVVPKTAFVVLCAALPASTALPREAKASAPSPTQCEALPEPGESETEGEMPLDALQAGLAPMSDLARRCMEASTASHYGRVVLALRIAGSRVREVCLMEDEIKNATLATCLVESTSALRFPQSSLGTFIDVYLPLRLEPLDDPAPRPTCAAP